MAQGFLGEMMVVEPGIAQQRGFQFLAGAEVVGAQDIRDAAVESLHHAIGLGMPRPGQAMLDIQFGAQLVEGVFPGGSPFPRGDEAIGEFLAVVGQDRLDAEWRRLGEGRQEAPGVGRRLGGVDRDEDPSGGPVDGHEQVAGGRLVEHLRYGLDVNVNAALVSQGPRKPSGGPFVIEIPMAWIEDC